MKPIEGLDHKGNQFTAGNPITGEQPTEITADWLNGVQDEILQVIKDNQLTPDSSSQLSQAITNAIEDRVVDNLTSADTNKALSAFQGNVLDGKIDLLQPVLTWYVDSAVGSSGDGKSWNTAFKTLAECFSACRKGVVNIVWIRQDHVYACGAETNGKNIVIWSEGNLNKTITVNGNSGNAFLTVNTKFQVIHTHMVFNQNGATVPFLWFDAGVQEGANPSVFSAYASNITYNVTASDTIKYFCTAPRNVLCSIGFSPASNFITSGGGKLLGNWYNNITLLADSNTALKPADIGGDCVSHNIDGYQTKKEKEIEASTPALGSIIMTYLPDSMSHKYIRLNAQELNRTTYKALYDLLVAKNLVVSKADWTSDPLKRGFFHSGDGVGTFGVPQTAEMFFKAVSSQTDIGKYFRDEMPKIEGSLQFGLQMAGVQASTGAFYPTVANQYMPQQATYVAAGQGTVVFDSSRVVNTGAKVVPQTYGAIAFMRAKP